MRRIAVQNPDALIQEIERARAEWRAEVDRVDRLRADHTRLLGVLECAKTALDYIEDNSGANNGCSAGCGNTARKALTEIARLEKE